MSMSYTYRKFVIDFIRRYVSSNRTSILMPMTVARQNGRRKERESAEKDK